MTITNPETGTRIDEIEDRSIGSAHRCKNYPPGSVSTST